MLPAFDAFELVNGIDAETSSFSRATCLTAQGVEEAKMIGAIFEISGVEIGDIYSSPSCRARQTARYAFGDEGQIEYSLLHRTAIPKRQHAEFAQALRTLIEGITVPAGMNVVLSGHGGTLGFDGDRVIDVSHVKDIDDREEGGFVVLEKVDEKIIAWHKFRSLKYFSNVAVELPLSRN